MGISTIVIAGHLQPVFPDRPGHHDVVDLSSGIVIQHVVGARSCGHPFKSAGRADRVVIVANEQ